ncbi:unnamed protein product [Camellia sinensis]
MEDIACLWSYQEFSVFHSLGSSENLQSIDELKQKLLHTTLELESIKVQANEELRKNRDYSNQLLQLLKITFHERDQAIDQLQKLQNHLTIPQIQPHNTPLPKPINSISSITDSDSLSTNSFFDSVSSPELSTINMPDSTNDQACLVIEKIVEGKSLPRKGELLQSVLEAGPLLQTLLVAGPLPRWRNPPPPLQPFKIPPVSDVNLSFGDNSLSSSLFVEMCCGSTTPVLDFGTGVSGCCLDGGKMIPAGENANCFPAGKRQRFQ